MYIQAEYLPGLAALFFFGLGYFAIDRYIKRKEAAEFMQSPAGHFAQRMANEVSQVSLNIRYFAVDADGTVIGSPCPLSLGKDGWESDREVSYLGIDPIAAAHWQDMHLPRKTVERFGK